jgi:hypothetical protein
MPAHLSYLTCLSFPLLSGYPQQPWLDMCPPLPEIIECVPELCLELITSVSFGASSYYLAGFNIQHGTLVDSIQFIGFSFKPAVWSGLSE